MMKGYEKSGGGDMEGGKGFDSLNIEYQGSEYRLVNSEGGQIQSQLALQVVHSTPSNLVMSGL